MAKLTGFASAFGGNTDQVDDTPQIDLKTRAQDADGNEYIYLQGVTGVSANTVVTFDEDGVTSLITANAVGEVAVAQAAIDSTDKYGWFCIYGKTDAAVNSGIADNSPLYIASTDGRFDDASTAGDLVVGAVSRSTDSSNVATVQLTYPVVTDTLG